MKNTVFKGLLFFNVILFSLVLVSMFINRSESIDSINHDSGTLNQEYSTVRTFGTINITVSDSQKNNHTAFDINRIKLLKVIKLVTETKTGLEFKPLIDELFYQDKIHITKLQNGHYGESGEGCLVKGNKYFYEGFFILLNESLSTEELAVSLTHEITHYRMIKDYGKLKFKFPTKVITFEISSFATQHEFISELESIKLIDTQNIFKNDSKDVLEIMLNAFNLRNNWSEKKFQQFFKQLVDYGYPENELNREISQRIEKNCVGLVDQ